MVRNIRVIRVKTQAVGRLLQAIQNDAVIDGDFREPEQMDNRVAPGGQRTDQPGGHAFLVTAPDGQNHPLVAEDDVRLPGAAAEGLSSGCCAWLKERRQS